jgi:hypothetical protein
MIDPCSTMRKLRRILMKKSDRSKVGKGIISKKGIKASNQTLACSKTAGKHYKTIKAKSPPGDHSWS